MRPLLLNLTTAASLLALPLIAVSLLEGYPRFRLHLPYGFRLDAPHLPALAVALCLPVARTIKFFYDTLRETRRDYRLTHYICLLCGYDLRHTPDRCPECGALPPASRLHADA